VNKLDLIRKFIRFIHEKIIDGKGVCFISAVPFLLIGRIADDEVEFHVSPSCMYIAVFQTVLPPPVIDAAEGLPVQLVLLFQRGVGIFEKACLLPVVFPAVGDLAREAVHLPEIPRGRIGDGAVFRRRGPAAPPGVEILSESHEEIYPGDEQVVPLKFIAVRRLEGAQRPCEPLRFVCGVFVHGAELPIEQTCAAADGDGFAGSGGVAGDEVRRFAAGDFQPPGVHIAPPVFLPGEGDALFGEAVPLPSEPRGVGEVHHLLDDRKRREDFRMAAGALGLLLQRFPRAGLDDVSVLSGDERRRDGPVPPVLWAASFVGVGRPEDAAFRRLVLEEPVQKTHGMEPAVYACDHVRPSSSMQESWSRQERRDRDRCTPKGGISIILQGH